MTAGITNHAALPQLESGALSVSARGFGWKHADRQQPALHALDLEVPAGQRVLLLGPSGAGKSTLLHAMAGVLDVSELAGCTGQLLVGEQDAFGPRQGVGLMQQDPETQIVQARVEDDVAFGAENLGVDPQEISRRIPLALEAVGLGQLAPEHPTQQLSGGQKQRLALAGILAMRPGLMLLDEPTANIDPEGALGVRDAVLNAAERTAATLIVVEHRVETWVEHVDRVLVLEPGGGISHDVAPQALLSDQPLRRELAEAGIWVPGYVPHTRTPRTSPGGELLRASALQARRSKKAPLTAAVDLELPAGGALVIRGANGVGKSTLALTLGGLLEPASGRLHATELLAGEAGDKPFLWRAGQLVARIGTVFQEPEHQFVTQSVADELAYGPRRAKGERDGQGGTGLDEQQIAERTAALLTRLRLDHLAEANPYTLSGGEKRRLSVATVLAASPDVLILDEPTFGQDANTWREVAELLIEVIEQGTAVIAVTHDGHFARALGARELELQAPAPRAEASGPDPLLGSAVGDSWLARRNPLAKLAAIVATTIPLVATIDWVSGLVVITATLLMLPLARLSIPRFLLRAWPLLLAGLTAAWGISLVGEDSGALLLDLGVFTITEGSLAGGIATGMRAMAMAVPMVLLLSTTNPSDLGSALSQQLRVPHRFVLGALAGMRLLGLLVEEFTTLTLARRARGVGNFGSPAQRLRANLGQVLALLVQAIRRAGRLAITMEAKGFGAGRRSWLRTPDFGWRDVLVIGAGLAVGALAVAAAVLAGTWSLVWG